MAKTTTRRFVADGNRYMFDARLTPAKGWAQIDDSQDAWYFGRWGNPEKRKLVSYVEGDVVVTSFDTDEEFVAELRRWARADTWVGIDPLLNEELEAKFVALGLGDLLH